MNTRFLKITASVLAALLLSACGSSSSDDKGGSTPQLQNISGSVIDPAISGASVTLICGTQTFNASSVTDADGKFSISGIPADVDLSTCMLEATGGVDGADDLSGLTLKSPYKMFNKNTGLYITPFTNAVAMHDAGDINTSLDAVATFFGVSKADLMLDPTSQLRLAKLTKKITKIALTRDANGNVTGYLDIDDNDVTASDLDDYVQTDLVIDANEKERLLEEFDAVDSSTDISQIIKSGIVGGTIFKLKKAYKKETYTSEEKANFRYLALKLTDMLSTVQGEETTYNDVTRFHLRKALNDLDMVPSFEGNNSLVENINLIIGKSDVEFEDYVDTNRTIDLSNASGLVLFNANTYEKVLGNDNAKRINYYTFSDKSNIAKILEISKNSYTDDVLDVVNSKVSNGLAKLGFGEEALENVKDNVYTPELKEKAYKQLGILFLSLDENEKAAEAYYKRYEEVKGQINAVGKENVSSTQTSELQAIAVKLVSAQDTTKANEVVAYLESLAPELGTTSGYARVVQALEDMSENVFIETGNKILASEYIVKGVEKTQDIPTDKPKTAVFYTYRAAITAAIFEQYSSAQDAKARATAIDPTEDYVDSSGVYSYYPVALEALMDSFDFNVTKAKFDAIASSKKDDATQYGYAAGLMLNGKADELFNDVYANTSIYSSSTQERIFYQTRIGSSTTFYTSMILKIRGENDILEDYLDRLYTFSKDYNLSSSSDMVKVFAKWGKKHRDKYGYLAMAKMYLDLSKTTKAETMLTTSIAKITALADTSKKIEGFINILNARKEIGLDTDAAQTSDIVVKIKEAALNENFTDEEDILTVANLLSANSAKSDATLLIEKVYGLLDTQADGDIDTIEDRVEILLGEKSNKGVVSANIVDSYLQTGDIAKATEMIDEAYANIMTMQDTVDRYALLVNVARAKASLNSIDGLDTLLTEIKTPAENNKAKIDIAEALADYDAFNLTDAASVDSDSDGKPDFWNTISSQEERDSSGLTLDEDIDNDGISDDEDTLPYDNIN